MLTIGENEYRWNYKNRLIKHRFNIMSLKTKNCKKYGSGKINKLEKQVSTYVWSDLAH